MDLGSAFVTVRDGEWLTCEVVWTGGMLVHPPDDEHGYMPSSLLAAGTVQPAKPTSGRVCRMGPSQQSMRR